MGKSMVTAKEYMQQQRKILWSIKSKTPEEKPLDGKRGECYVAITLMTSTGYTFPDETGRFPVLPVKETNIL